MIDSFTGANRFLSNFYLCKVRFRNLDFGSSEAAFHSGKTLDEDIRRKFCTLGPAESKAEGRRIQIVSNWDEVRVATMAEVIHCKYVQNKDLRAMLVETFPHELIEGNWHNDIFWGTVAGIGKNWLGRLSMAERAFWINIAETEPVRPL